MSESKPPGGGARRGRAPTPAERAAAAGELGNVRERIDDLDRRLVELLNERAALGLAAGRAKHVAGRRAVKDPDREREVLIRVAMANPGPMSQADLLAIYRRILAATRGLESRDRARSRGRTGAGGGAVAPGEAPGPGEAPALDDSPGPGKPAASDAPPADRAPEPGGTEAPGGSPGESPGEA